MRKGIYFGSLPKDLSWSQKFALARKAGFDGVEISTIENPNECRENSTKMEGRLALCRITNIYSLYLAYKTEMGLL